MTHDARQPFSDDAGSSGQWWWCRERKAAVRVLEWRQLWAQDIAIIWIPEARQVCAVAASSLEPLNDAGVVSSAELAWRAAAARVVDALVQGLMLSPLEGTVIPLPHQLKVLSRALSQERIRYLLADEVGLGKTIEAGLILRELKLSGRIRRILIMAPKGLVMQWVQEMQTRFNETFQLLLPSDLPTLHRIHPGTNPWTQLDQVVCPIDSFKPLEKRRGWTPDQVRAYNRERSGLLLAAGWDLIIVDEAHRLGGSTDEVARYRLGEALAAASPYLLLLSATPHQGKSDGFLRLMRLLDRDAFPDGVSLDPARVHPFVIRTEKRHAIDAQGNPLFRPRRTRLCPVAWTARQTLQQELYEAVTEYVREGYNRALSERRFALGFLMILMQRLVTSSTRAIRTSLERRLATLLETQHGVSAPLPPGGADVELDDPEADMQLALEFVLQSAPEGLNERREVEFLLELARRVEADGADSKALALVDLMMGFRRAEENPELKFLVFTEFVPTQEMLAELLMAHGFRVTCLNGRMDLETRRTVQATFASQSNVLISTDAGGEGLNLQFCHTVINFDLPWNPMRIEQRIGRVDRIGQLHDVNAVHLVLEGTVEYRVREVLEQKLATILAEFGVDKSSDVLESVEAGAAFDRLYADVVVNPEAAGARVDALVADIRSRATSLQNQAKVLSGAPFHTGDPSRSGTLDPEPARAVLNHPLPAWIETLVLNYLADRGGSWRRESGQTLLFWPDGSQQKGVFDPAEAAQKGVRLLSIQDPRIRPLALECPSLIPGSPIACTDWPGLSSSIQGMFGIFRVALEAQAQRARRTPLVDDPRKSQRILPLFLHSDGRSLATTARHLMDRLLEGPPPLTGHLTGEASVEAWTHLTRLAEKLGAPLYQELMRTRSDESVAIPRLEPLLVLAVRKGGI